MNDSTTSSCEQHSSHENGASLDLLCSELYAVSGRVIHRYLEDNRISRDSQNMEREWGETIFFCTFPAESISGTFMSHMCHILETSAFHIHLSFFG